MVRTLAGTSNAESVVQDGLLNKYTYNLCFFFFQKSCYLSVNMGKYCTAR